jgi:hypothetical protein
MPDLGADLQGLFTKAREVARLSREKAANMRTALKISRRIVKACARLQKAANRDERKVRLDDLPAIKADLETRLVEIRGMINEIFLLDFPGVIEITNRLGGAEMEMREQLTRNWPIFVEKVQAEEVKRQHD